jgi:hypothetical protein
MTRSFRSGAAVAILLSGIIAGADTRAQMANYCIPSYVCNAGNSQYELQPSSTAMCGAGMMCPAPATLTGPFASGQACTPTNGGNTITTTPVQCISGKQCVNDSVCPIGWHCDTTNTDKCVIGCAYDTCLSGQYCDTTATPPACKAGCDQPGMGHGGCPVGQFCDIENRKCVAGCESDDNCLFGTVCNIVPGSPPGQCVTGCYPCDGHYVCESSAVQCEALSTVYYKRGCPDGTLCVPNSSGNNFWAPWYWAALERVILGTCVKGGCSDSVDCNYPSGVCWVVSNSSEAHGTDYAGAQQRQCVKPQDVACNTDSDCPRLTYCNNGKCEAGCANDMACVGYQGFENQCLVGSNANSCNLTTHSCQ